MRDLFGLPEQFEGVFVSGATQANLVSLATARQWAAQRLDVDVSDIVCFALRGANNKQRDKFLEKLTKDGQVLLTPTFFEGKPAIRAAFANWSTSEQDILIILDALERYAPGI